jgi:hypothetical protein
MYPQAGCILPSAVGVHCAVISRMVKCLPRAVDLEALSGESLIYSVDQLILRGFLLS